MLTLNEQRNSKSSSPSVFKIHHEATPFKKFLFQKTFSPCDTYRPQKNFHPDFPAVKSGWKNFSEKYPLLCVRIAPKSSESGSAYRPSVISDHRRLDLHF
jgi:hypothetical protein